MTLDEITKKYRLNFIVLFGSTALGLTHAKSDVDVAYSPRRVLTYKEEHALVKDLRQALKTQKEVEAVDIHRAPPHLNKQVVFQGKLLVEATPYSFARFQAFAFKCAVEARRLQLMSDAFVASNL